VTGTARGQLLVVSWFCKRRKRDIDEAPGAVVVVSQYTKSYHFVVLVDAYERRRIDIREIAASGLWSPWSQTLFLFCVVMSGAATQ
jgi:hypothetical protein